MVNDARAVAEPAASGYEPSAVLGLLVALTICSALIADLLLLPALLMAIDRRKA